ncbi:chromosome partitioning ATPase [Novosphingobium sediminis]|uniref:Chromosome partitioning ATPase n=1 Tax=Novosphingobium sediminis TaxID=707214 RepID=A0A512AGW2_9SPHN|nr:capsular biosynthesis protein [Novosphingobium sediminis]GEN98882.1 chromosome partitioning ATPase [Novosphingobium sediminis]
MTEQSKIPVPKDTSEARSLIERAAGTFDLRAFQAPLAPKLPEPRERAPFSAEAAEPAQPVQRVAPPARPEAAPPAFDGIPARQAFRGVFHPIDRKHLREQSLIEPEGPVTGLLEEFRIVKRQLLMTAAESRAGRGAPHGNRILVCSSHPGEGKTFCAVNLALSIAAEKDTEVLLVDADFAKPSVLSALGLPGGRGLMDALADPDIAVEDCIIGTDIAGFFVLPAGNSTGHDTEHLASAYTAQVLARLTAQAPNRIVIFDSPPVLAASPASELAHHVGQALMVVRADQTGEAALRDAVGILSGCEDIKLLLNCTRFSPTGRRFGSYYGYKE